MSQSSYQPRIVRGKTSLSGYDIDIGEPIHLPTVGSFPADPFLHVLPNGVLMVHSYFCDSWGFQSKDGGQSWDLVTFGLGCSAVNCSDGTVVAMDYRTYSIAGASKGPFQGRGCHVEPDYRAAHHYFQTTVEVPGARTLVNDTGTPGGGLDFWRSIVEAEEGTLLATAYGAFDHNDEPPLGYPKEWNMRRFESVLLESHDKGRTWKRRAMIAGDRETGQEGFCEPVMVSFGDGELVVVMRTGRASPLYQSRSTDYGYTWSQPKSLHVPGVDPSLLLLADGTLVLGWGTRVPDAPFDKANLEDYQNRFVEGQGDPPLVLGGYIAFSRDRGRSYSRPIMLDDQSGQSYTALAEPEPGRLLFAIRHNWRKYRPGNWQVGEGRSVIYPITLQETGGTHGRFGQE